MSETIDLNLAQALISEAELLVEKHREKRKSGADFNVFRLLDRHESEVKGHSALIAEFLNPNGMHGQGDLFLNMFFKTLKIDKQLEDCRSWDVIVEAGKNVIGRIDILLIGRYSNDQKVGIAIENKIFAGLQERQLGRYYDFLEMNFGAYRGNDSQVKWLLYYLTLKGSDPSVQSVEGIPDDLCSWNRSTQIEASFGFVPIKKISYKKHIQAWMTACHEHLADQPWSCEIVAQYIETIKGLTGGGNSMPERLKDLLSTPEKVMAAAQLSRTVDLVRSDIVQKLWDEIKQAWEIEAKANLENKGNGAFVVSKLMPNIHCKFDDDRLMKLSRDYFTKKSQRDKYFGLYSKAYSSSWGRVWLEVRFDEKFYVGLYGENDKRIFPKSAVKELYEMSHPLYEIQGDDKIQDFDRIFLKAKKPINFNSNDPRLFNLRNDKARGEFVRDVIETLKYMIKAMCLEITVSENNT